MELSNNREGAMVTGIREGSYAYRVLRDVLTAGEMRYNTLRLYANDGAPAKNVQKAVYRLLEKGLLKIAGAGSTKALRYVYSSGNNRIVTALYGDGILDRLMSATNGLHYTTSSRSYQDKRQRRWRMGEVCAMLDGIGCPVWQGKQNANGFTAYGSMDIRQSCQDTNLAANSRLTAGLASDAAAYAIYNIGPALQVWNREAERRGRRAMELAMLHKGHGAQTNDAICFYSRHSAPAEYIRGYGRIKGTVKHKCIGIHNAADVYRRLHMLPLDPHGKAMLKLLCIPDLNGVLCDMFGVTANAGMPILCHGYGSDTVMFFALTGELNGLHSFLTGYSMGLGKTVVCWDWQREMIAAFAAEQGLDVTIWDYEEKDLIDELQRRNEI